MSSWLLMAIIVGCSTNSAPPNALNFNGNFEGNGLASIKVNELKTHTDMLYSGTKQGLYVTSTVNSSSNPTWTPLYDEKIVQDFVIWDTKNLLIGTPISSSKEISIFISRDGGSRWQPYQNGFGTKNSNSYLYVVKKHPKNPEILLARGDYNVALSPDSGKSWQNLIGSWNGFGGGFFLTIDPSNPQILWAGGVNATFTPHLIKSTSDGDSWTRLSTNFNFNTETTVYDVAVHPEDPGQVLAGAGGSVPPANVIRKTTDGGQSWKTVHKGVNARTLVNSARNPETVYASGRNANGTLFFAASGDFGDNWEIIEWENSPPGVQVNDMVSVMVDGQEVLYFGTNKGVYTYTFEE